MPTDDLDTIDDVMREAAARKAADGRRGLEADRTAHLEYAWRLFDRICERDPGAVGDKAAMLAAFKECLDMVRRPPADPLSDWLPDLDDKVPF